MSRFAIETVGLNHQFGKQAVVKNLSLQVHKGSIYGFLGPNGAGKTCYHQDFIKSSAVSI